MPNLALARSKILLGGIGEGLRKKTIFALGLNEASSTRFDSSPNSRDFTANNAPGSAAGKVSNAVDYVSASAQYLSRPFDSGLDFNTRSFSVSTWVRFATLPAPGVNMSPISQYNGGNSQRWLSYLFGSSGRMRAVMGLNTNLDFGPVLSATTWYHVIFWRDVVNLVIAGRVNTESSIGTISSAAFSAGGFGGAFASQVLCGGYVDGSVIGLMNGRQDCTQIFDGVLSEVEQIHLWNGGLGREWPY